ncbi:MAG: hypothetical protein QM802_24470 [Agriterribacter sp.]
MNIINRIFRSNMAECPRCLGKGKVDLEDIKRLKKELFWTPGKCAYCNGIGKVPPDRIEKLSADFEYLTTDLPSWERHKVINADEHALKRAGAFKDAIQTLIGEIEHLYYIENKEPAEIAAYFFHKQDQYVYSDEEKQEMINYIKKVIKSKREH